MAVLSAPQVHEAREGEVRVVSVDLTSWLDSGETLTGSVTMTELGTSDLTFANQQVSGGSLTINGATVDTAKAIQFKVSGQLAATGKYNIQMQVATTGGLVAQTLKPVIRLNAIENTAA